MDIAEISLTKVDSSLLLFTSTALQNNQWNGYKMVRHFEDFSVQKGICIHNICTAESVPMVPN